MAISISAASAGASNGITGAGSTLIAPLLERWKVGFEQQAGISVTYGPVGSGTGIADITARSVDFGASDAPLTPAQAAACNGCVQIPWALTATGIGFKLPGIYHIRLTGPVLANIYLGKITKWNSPALVKLNPKAKLPNLPITVVFRSDGSGDTYAFTDYLSRVSPAWRSKVGFATTVSFPTGNGAKGNAGVSAVVGSTEGAIGYISASYLLAHKIGAAQLQNAAGRFEYPNIKNIESAAQAIKKVPANNALHIVAPPKSAKIAYPLSTFTYAIVPRGSSKASMLRSFINYALGEGQVFGPALDFAPLPAIVVKAAKASIGSI